MGADAGFAAAVTIRQQVLQDALTASYCNGGFPQTLNHALPGNDPSVLVDLFLGEPGISCEGSTGLLVVSLPVWGPVTVTFADATIVQITGRIEATLMPSFVPGPPVALSPLGTVIDVRAWSATVLTPGTPSDVFDFVTGEGLREQLEAGIRGAVLMGAITLPTIDVSFLGFTDHQVTSVQALVVDGALLLGLSVGDQSGVGAISGNPNALADFAGTFDVAGAVNPAAVPLLLTGVRTALVSNATGAGATLDELTAVPADGHFHLAGSISNSSGTLKFSFDVVPELSYSMPAQSWTAYTLEHWVDDPRPRWVKTRTWPALWFTTANPVADVSGSWWVDLLEGLTLGIFLLYVLPEFSNTENTFEYAIKNHPPGAPEPRVRRTITPPGGVSLRTALDSFQISAGGVSTGIHVSATPTTIAVIGPETVPVTYASQPLRYLLRLPSGAFPSDPWLSVAWTLSDAASGSVLTTSSEKVTDASPAFEFQPSSFASVSQFRIAATLYRQFGTDVVEVGTQTAALGVREALAPGAYLRWRAQSVKWGVVFDTATGQWNYGGDVHVQRQSRWHRTDAPCEAARTGPDAFGRHAAQVADTLPFPLQELEQFRGILCAYCFFGGPAGLNAQL